MANDPFPYCTLDMVKNERERLQRQRDSLDATLASLETSIAAKLEWRAALPYDAMGDFSRIL